jgi:hypothetical protein
MYNIQFSAQINHVGGGSRTINIWFRKNDSNIPWSNTKVFSKATGDYIVAAWNIFEQLTPNDYLEIMFYSGTTDVFLVAELGNDVPAIPSVILTVNQVN